jgi:hypothetical protein
MMTVSNYFIVINEIMQYNNISEICEDQRVLPGLAPSLNSKGWSAYCK